jgi:predicted kinase
VLDYGFWKKSKREKYKKLAKELNADWKLVYFKLDSKNLKQRLKDRNRKGLVSEHLITDEMLDKFVTEFEEPINEGESLHQYNNSGGHEGE